MNKYVINYHQIGGNNNSNRIVLQLRESICIQANNIINFLLNFLFIPQNSGLWSGTDFYNIFGNEYTILNLNISQLEYMIDGIRHRSTDASYSAKIGMVKHVLNTIGILKDSLHTLGSDINIISINDIVNLKINCSTNHVPRNFNENIQIQTTSDSNHLPPNNTYYNNYSPMPPIPPIPSISPISNIPYNIRSKQDRCIYRDPTCIGDKDVITLEDITKNNIHNVVKVDEKCYDADELQKWLVNNSNLPHNRQEYNYKKLNECVQGNNSASLSSSSTLIDFLTPSISSNIYSQNIIPQNIYSNQLTQTPIFYKKTKIYDEDDDDFFDNEDDIIENTDSNYINSYNNKAKISKKKTSKKKTSKKKISKKKTSKKKTSKKKTSKKKTSIK